MAQRTAAFLTYNVDRIYQDFPIRVCLLNFTANDLSFQDANISGTEITVTPAPDQEIGDRFQLASSGTLPSPGVVSTDYYLVSKVGSVIELSAEPGGTPISWTGNDGAANHTLLEQAPGLYSPLESWVRHESTAVGYERVTQVFPAATLDISTLSNPKAVIATTQVTFVASGSAIDYNGAFEIIDGDATKGLATQGTVGQYNFTANLVVQSVLNGNQIFVNLDNEFDCV